MHNYKKQLSLFFFVALFFGTFAQSPDYSQTFTNLVFTNPAFAGSRVCPRLYANYRNKYTNLGSAYVNYLASYDQYFYKLKGDIAFVAFRDVQANGVITTSYLNAIYAKAIALNSIWRLKLGLEAGYISSQLSNANQSYSDMIDPVYGYVFSTSETPLNIKQQGLDISSGILLFSPKFYVGFSSHHLNRAVRTDQTSGYIAGRTFSLHGGAQFSLGNDLATSNTPILLAPNFNFQFQNHFSQLLLGLYVQRSKLLTGLWIKQTLKNLESFVLLVGYVQKKYKFAYNCDLYFWDNKLALPETHEVSVTYYFSCSEHKKKPKAMNCPGL